MDIFLTGSLAFDRIMNFPGVFSEHILPEKIHDLNVSFNIDRLIEKRGGTAGNIAYSVALLGQTPTIVASAGKDIGSYLQAVESWGLPTTRIAVHDTELTAVANIMTDQKDNQITAFYMGAMAVETDMQIADLPNPSETLVVLSAGNKADMLRYSTECKEFGVRYMFDPGQTIPFLTPEELKTLIFGADMFVTNDYELQMIMNRTGLTEEQILGQVRTLVTTKGKDGSTFISMNGRVDVPACRVADVKDPTGAGDAFRAGMLAGLAAGASVEQLGRLGATAAAYVVETVGTQEHHYSHENFAARYTEQFGEPCPLF